MAASKSKPLPYLILIGLVGIATLLVHKTTDVTSEATAGLEMSLPAKVGLWTGKDGDVQPIEREYLGADTEFCRKLYTRTDGREIFLGILLSGRDRSSIHAAEACLVGQGWTLGAGEIVGFSMLQPKPYTLDVMRIPISRKVETSKGEMELRNTYYYWFVGKTRLTPRHAQRILWTAFDRIFFNVHHRWAYVTVTVPNPSGSEEETEKMAQDFLQQVVPTFQHVTP